jgi:ABC-type amino acid transport substrate-binding protein
VFVAFVTMLLLSACGGLRQRADIDLSDLHGVRVGVNLAWESDYLLTSRGDAEIYRYDMSSDMLMALNYNKIDAMATDLLSLRMMQFAVDGVRAMEPPIGKSGYMMVFSDGHERLRDDFDAFLVDYEQSEDYANVMARLESFQGLYEGPDATPTSSDDADATGEAVRVAVCDDGYPRSFYEVGEEEPLGYEIEVVRAWAKASNRRIAWCRSSYEDAVAGVMAGKYDAIVGWISSLYAEEAEAAGLYPSSGFCECPLYLTVKEGDAIRVTGEIE